MEINRDAIRANVQAGQALSGPGNALVAVVKANAYGHGAASVARTCMAAGVRHFAVACLAEGLELRQAQVAGDIYTLSAFLPGEAAELVRADLTPWVSSGEQLAALGQAAKQGAGNARCFLTIDTGMGREGCHSHEVQELWQQAERWNVPVAGIATHFSSADEAGAQHITNAQTEAFTTALDAVGIEALQGANNGRSIWLSLCNSPATVCPPPTLRELDRFGPRGLLFRAGLLLYGIAPFAGAYANAAFRPALSWHARITLVRDFPYGATIGYNRTHTLSRPARVATVATGYADGLPRRLSDTGYVLRNNQRLPILGRVSMDQCQIDVTDATPPVQIGDVVTLIGESGAERQSIWDIAAQIGTTPHEVPCLITNRVPRVYTG